MSFVEKLGNEELVIEDNKVRGEADALHGSPPAHAAHDFQLILLLLHSL